MMELRNYVLQKKNQEKLSYLQCVSVKNYVIRFDENV